MKVLTAKITEQVDVRIKKLAAEKGLTVSSMARELLEQALSRQDLHQAIGAQSRQIAVVREQLDELGQKYDNLVSVLKAGFVTEANKIQVQDFHSYKAQQNK